MSSFEEAFDLWFSSLSFEEREFFLPYSLRSLWSLRQVRIDWDFLWACSRHWDPSCHVFRFGDAELCPLSEELGAILGYREGSPAAIPVIEGSISRDFNDLLGLKRSAVKTILVEGMIDLRYFLLMFFPYSTPYLGAIERKYRKRAFLFCLLHRFLFVGAERDRGYPHLVRLVDPLINDFSPSVMIQGETLMALDRLYYNLHEAFSGSPLLLQIWLQERLACVLRPRDIEGYRAHSFPSRRICISYDSRSEWMNYLHGSLVRRFRINWWHLQTMVGGNNKVTHVRIPGLTRSTFFNPHRVRRQYGLTQRIPFRDDEPPEDKDLSERFLERWGEYWGKMTRWTVPGVPDSAYATDFYHEWTTCQDPEKRTQLRQLEDEWYRSRTVPAHGITIREPDEHPPRRKKDKGKGKGKMREEDDPPRKGRRDDGSSSGR